MGNRFELAIRNVNNITEEQLARAVEALPDGAPMDANESALLEAVVLRWHEGHAMTVREAIHLAAFGAALIGLFGGAMVLIMVWRPQGLLAHREPTLKLKPKGAP